jgi:inner membrane protein
VRGFAPPADLAIRASFADLRILCQGSAAPGGVGIFEGPAGEVLRAAGLDCAARSVPDPARRRTLDNICHTLAGAAFAEAGLRRATPLATATLLIGANLPDLDGLSYVFGSPVEALAFRRGWTHGALAMAVLPAALAAAMSAWDRLVRRRRRPHAEPARFRALWTLAFVSVLSHPLLDLLNTYGVRLLMPFSGRWYYADALFIVDPWLWAALAIGFAWSRARRWRKSASPETPARSALWLSGAYVAVMIVSGLAGRSVAAREARAAGLEFTRWMVGPVPWDPMTRMAVFESTEGYRFGTLRFLDRPALRLKEEAWPKGDTLPAARAAASTAAGRDFLLWSRFPAYRTEPGEVATRVQLLDARYPGPLGSWASVTVEVPTPPGQAGAAPRPGAILAPRAGGSP